MASSTHCSTRTVRAVVLLSAAEGGVNVVEKAAVMKSCNFVQCYWNGNFSCDKCSLEGFFLFF